MSIRIVIGVDPSLSNTGLARSERDAPTDLDVTAVDGGKGGRKDSLQRRADRLHMIGGHISATIGTWRGIGDGHAPILLVIEGPALARTNGSSWDRAGLWWRIVSTALSRGASVAVVPPMTRAKWATGKGNADKAAVASALYRRFGVNADSSDEADAAVLALMGAHQLGWLDTQPQYAVDQLRVVDWPACDGHQVVA